MTSVVPLLSVRMMTVCAVSGVCVLQGTQEMDKHVRQVVSEIKYVYRQSLFNPFTVHFLFCFVFFLFWGVGGREIRR